MSTILLRVVHVQMVLLGLAVPMAAWEQVAADGQQSEVNFLASLTLQLQDAAKNAPKIPVVTLPDADLIRSILNKSLQCRIAVGGPSAEQQSVDELIERLEKIEFRDYGSIMAARHIGTDRIIPIFAISSIIWAGVQLVDPPRTDRVIAIFAISSPNDNVIILLQPFSKPSAAWADNSSGARQEDTNLLPFIEAAEGLRNLSDESVRSLVELHEIAHLLRAIPDDVGCLGTSMRNNSFIAGACFPELVNPLVPAKVSPTSCSN